MKRLNIPTIVKAAGLCILLLFASCHSGKRKYVIPEKRFTNFLVDLHIAEAIAIQSGRMIIGEYEIDSASLYGSVFRKHNVTQAMFDSTLLFYSHKPDKFEKIYSTVNRRLQSMEQAITDEQTALEQAKTTEVWKSESTYVFTSGVDKVEISVPLQGPGKYTVSVTAKILPDDATLDPRMSLYFWREDSTAEGKQIRFPETRYTLRNGNERTYNTTRRLDSTNYTYLKGYVINFSNFDSVFRRNMVIKDIVVTKQE